MSFMKSKNTLSTRDHSMQFYTCVFDLNYINDLPGHRRFLLYPHLWFHHMLSKY